MHRSKVKQKFNKQSIYNNFTIQSNQKTFNIVIVNE